MVYGCIDYFYTYIFMTLISSKTKITCTNIKCTLCIQVYTVIYPKTRLIIIGRCIKTKFLITLIILCLFYYYYNYY